VIKIYRKQSKSLNPLLIKDARCNCRIHARNGQMFLDRCFVSSYSTWYKTSLFWSTNKYLIGIATKVCHFSVTAIDSYNILHLSSKNLTRLPTSSFSIYRNSNSNQFNWTNSSKKRFSLDCRRTLKYIFWHLAVRTFFKVKN
jgi:hypothetical protein